MNFYKYSLPLGASIMILLFSLALTWYVGSEVRNIQVKVDGETFLFKESHRWIIIFMLFKTSSFHTRF